MSAFNNPKRIDYWKKRLMRRSLSLDSKPNLEDLKAELIVLESDLPKGETEFGGLDHWCGEIGGRPEPVPKTPTLLVQYDDDMVIQSVDLHVPLEAIVARWRSYVLGKSFIPWSSHEMHIPEGVRREEAFFVDELPSPHEGRGLDSFVTNEVGTIPSPEPTIPTLLIYYDVLDNNRVNLVRAYKPGEGVID